MKKQIILKGKTIDYEIRKSYRARNLRLSYYPDKGLVVTIPWISTKGMAQKFMQAKSSWILKRINEGQDNILIKASRGDYLELKEEVRSFATERVDRFNRLYNFTYNRIFIRNQKTRWGSCSAKKNLNYNYKIIKLPQYMADYIIVHELCHLKELNHSQSFWDLVAYTIPDYKKIRKEFRKIRVV